MIAGVFVNSYYRESVDCFVPENLRKKIGIFQRVFIKNGPDKIIGLVAHIGDNTQGRDTGSMLQITHVVDKEPVINQEQFELAQRVADHYLCARSDVIFAMIPSGKREKILPPSADLPVPVLPDLNEDQRRVFQKIIEMPVLSPHENSGKINVHLIHGITGSGKTRIYIELIREYMKKQLGVIFLIPEIALSYQFLETFKPVFGDQMAILHSGLSRAFRFSEYKRVLKDQARLVIGTRSAVFAPVKDLGLVIIDEEHDSSFKEHTSTKYHAKWVAGDRLRHKSSWPFQLPLSLVLGSATPAIESMYYAQKNIFTLHELKKRATGQLMPQIYIPLHQPADDGADVLSPFLVRKMEEHLKRGNQTILILNRRGYNNCAFCSVCEQNVMCPHCSVSLTYHRLDSNPDSVDKNVLKCHLCGYHETYRVSCKECGTKLKLLGKGIQKVEDALEFHFPKSVYARMDQDSVSAKGYAEDVITAMVHRRIDILIGTQMIAKGFDLPGVTLVGLLNTDIGLSLPDFRASERVFQLLVQATGRAGRHSAGEVVMQTMQPGHYAVSAASESDYKTFYERELGLRRKMNYPPFCRLLRILFRSKNEETLWHFINRLKMHIQEISSENSLFDRQSNRNLPAEILGPIEASLYKINNEFRVHLIVKDQSLEHLKDFGKNIKNYYQSQRRKFEGIKADFDLDPLDVL
jgi:primosomal protein N' (replication factor Y)